MSDQVFETEHQHIESALERPRRRLYAQWVFNLALMLSAMSVVMVTGEFFLRHRFGETGYQPSPEVLAIQQHLVLNDAIGFTWRPNISDAQNIVLDVADVEFEPLSTDRFGFINHPGAIAARESGNTIEVLGLGDSFMEHAAHIFFDRFAEAGLNYYSLAIHRQTPPQHARTFDHWGADLRPRWVLLGLFENDFIESSDFESWKGSGKDWFTYHSGTWCGPAEPGRLEQRLIKDFVPGWYQAFRNSRSNLRGGRMTVSGPRQGEIEFVASSIRQVALAASGQNARFMLILIPSKHTVLNGPTLESDAFDQVVEQVTGMPDAAHGISSVEIVDLRTAFERHPNPKTLFYKDDGHWSPTGMTRAAAVILRAIEAAD